MAIAVHHRSAIGMTAAIVLLLSLAIGKASGSAPPSKQISEAQVKAAFLYNFSKFIEWPAQSFSGPAAPFVIGVIGSDSFAGTLEELIRDKTVNGRSIVVRVLLPDADLKSCQMVFISEEAIGRAPKTILENAKGAGVLTVGETERFAERGGIINFFLRDDKLRFEINIDAATRAGLRVSSKLLSLAKIVHEKQQEGR